VRIFVNGDEREIPEGVTIAGLVSETVSAPSGRGVAVAVDAAVVPRSEWGETLVAEGQRVEILVAIQGG
jgi:sulfur carrier protein